MLTDIVSESTVLRATSMTAFNDCPARWCQEHPSGLIAGNEEGEGGEFAARGRAVHEECAAVLRGLDPTSAGWGAAEARLRAAGVPPPERNNAFRYACGLWDRLNAGRWSALSVEGEFRTAIEPGVPLVKGTMDVLWWDEEERCWVIQDHKTNRRWEGVAEWAARLQPLTYAWALRQSIWNRGFNGDRARIDFEIGYVNLGESVRWTTDAAADAAAAGRLKLLWQEWQVYDRTEEWPERLNRWCSSCPRLRACGAAQRALEEVSELAGEPHAPGRLKRLSWLRAVRKIGEALEEQTAAEVRAAAREAGGELREDGWVATLQPRKRREANFRGVWGAINTRGLPFFTDEEVNDLFAVRLVSLDQALKSRPTLKAELELHGAVAEVEQEPTLQVREVKEVKVSN